MPTADKSKHRVHCIVYRAVKRGELDPPYYLTCVNCGYSPCEYHHEDYGKPLEVIPMCRGCHRRRHIEMRIQNYEYEHRRHK